MSDSSGTNSWTLVTPEETAAESLRSHTELAEHHEGSNTSTAERTGCTSSVEGSATTSELPVDERQVSEDRPDLGEQPSPDAILTPTPSTEDPTPSTEDPSPITEDPSPITEDPSPITEDHTPVTEGPTDDPTPVTTDPTHETPDAPHTLVTDDPRPPSSLHLPGHSASDGNAHSQSEGLPEGRAPPSPEPDSFSDSYTHVSPSPEEPPASMLTPETLGGEELVQERGATEHQPLEGEGLGREEEESELSPRVTDFGKQADSPVDSEGWEEKGGEEGAAGLRKRRTVLTPLERIGRSDEEEDAEEEEEEEEYQPPHREDEFSFSLNKCILGAIILLGIGTVFFSGIFIDLDDENEYEAYRELRDAEIPVKQEWSNTEGPPSLADDAELLKKLDEGTEPTSDLQAQLQAQREELKVAQGQAMEGAKERLRREAAEEENGRLERENERLRSELESVPALHKELDSLRAALAQHTLLYADLPPSIASEDPLGVPDPLLKTHGPDSSSATSSPSSSSPPSPLSPPSSSSPPSPSSPSPNPLADGAPPPPDTEAAETPAGHTGDGSQEAHGKRPDKPEREKKQKDKKKDKYDTGEKEWREKKEWKEREKADKRKEKEREKRKYEEERGKEGKEWQNKEAKKKQKKEWKEKVEWKKQDDKGKQWKGKEGKKESEEKRDERKDGKGERKGWKKDKQEKWSNSGKEGRGKDEWKDEKKGRKEHQGGKEEGGWKKGKEESWKGGKEKEEKKHWKNRDGRDKEKEWKETSEKKHGGGGGKGEWKKDERKKEEWRKDGGRLDKDKDTKHHRDNHDHHDHRHDDHHDHRHDDHHDHRRDDHHGHRDGNVWHAGKGGGGGSSRQAPPSMEHPGYWLHQRHKLQRNVSPPQLQCDSLEACAQAQGLAQPVAQDQFQAVLQGYLAKAEAAGVEASRTDELRRLASEFFPGGVFAHHLMSFQDFTEDVADILEDMVEEEEEEEEGEEEEEEEDSALEQEMDGFEEEVMRRFGAAVVAAGKEGGKGKRGERKVERGRG